MELNFQSSLLDLDLTVTRQDLSLTLVPRIVTTLSFPMVGLNGLSAYQVAVENGFVGTEQQWLDSFQTGGTGTFTWTTTQW